MPDVEPLRFPSREGRPSQPVWKISAPDQSGQASIQQHFKKINEVLCEVTCLIERLEADRQDAEEALRKEKRRKRFLENQIDGISQWKKQERSLLIQKEHDGCIKEISELKWQLKLDREKLDQAQEKLSYAEAWNRSLREDIDFAKKQIPIVKANLDLQRGIINQINAAQAESDEVYANARREFLLLDEEKKKMELDANDEMISMDRALSVTKNQLASTLDELKQLKMLEEAMWAEIKEAEKTIALTGDKCSATTRRVPELLELEKTENDSILQSELEIEDEMRKNTILKETLVALQGEIEKTRLLGEAEVSRVEEQLLSKRNAFAALRRENMECEQKVEDYKMKISER
ncbi:Coiled-coil domain-containing protein 178 [Liparis tanakae]|uniref:Coiled-coil domain-containing protein 178 n=1 Tax=Liparis tanakae TaxID=230148 RepID=A0A4Z2HJ25_9TELE|nr:Coiled-coil domain-containing protein 178 [Liparis tanakae]